MIFRIRFSSFCLAILLLAVPLLTSCNGEKSTGTVPPTGGATTEAPTTAAPPPAEPIEGGPIATNAKIGAAWRTYVVDPEASIAGAYSRVGLTALSSEAPFYSTADTEALAAILAELRGLEDHVIGVFEPTQTWRQGVVTFRQGGLTFYASGKPDYVIRVWFDDCFLQVITAESSCYFLLDVDTADVSERVRTLVGRGTGTLPGYTAVIG